MAKRRMREENPKRGSEGMRDGYQSKMKETFIAGKHRDVIVTCIVLIPARPLTRVTSKIVHHATVIQVGKQTIQLFRERYTET
jgi:hypothetical protein